MTPDIRIIEACGRNDRKAQFEIYNLLFRDMMCLARRYRKNEDEAKSIVNDAFFKVFTQISSYRKEVPFILWVRRITINTVIDEFRKNKKMRDLEETTDFTDYAQTWSLPAEVINLAEQRLMSADVQRLIDALDEEEQVVFNLFEIEGYSHREIAAELGVSERTSKRYLNEARRKLKDKLQQLLPEAKSAAI
jgi:RNA polymerase sigma-70 factor (ECF subfamily)